MSNVFVSYNRRSEAIARTLANDIEALGHIVKYDQELSGGQVWWDHILKIIRDCDVFVFVLSPESLNSIACKREFGYAAELGKTILPILVAEGVSPNLLPPVLSQIQFVDYRDKDRDAAFRLARAFASTPPPGPLPDPLPPPPEAPISFLGSLTDTIETTATLSYETQSALVVDLKRSWRDPETSDDTRTLLKRLRKRRDLFATIAQEIDELLQSTRKVSPVHPRTSETEPPSPGRWQKEEPLSTPAESKPQEKLKSQHSNSQPASIRTDQKPKGQVSSAGRQNLHADGGVHEGLTVTDKKTLPSGLPHGPANEQRKPEMIYIEKQAEASQPDAKLITLVAVSMFFGVFTYFSLGLVSIDLFYLQIFSCLFIGYRYHRRAALIAGAMIFLPNLVLHLMGNYIEITSNTATGFLDFAGDSFRGRARLFESVITCRTLGIAYFYYAPFAFAVAITRAKLNSLLETEAPLSLKKIKFRKSATIGYAAAIIFLPSSIASGPFQAAGFYALLPLFSIWVYRYGLRQIRKLLVVFLIIQILGIRADFFSFFMSVEYTFLPIFLLLLIVYSDLKVDDRKADTYGGYVLSMILICLLTPLTFRLTKHFSFQTVALALPWLFFLGYKYGCRSGLLGSVILGCAMTIRFYLSEALVWGGYSTMYFMAAPLIGYLGGTDFIKKDFLGNGMKIFGIYYGANLLATATNYGFTTVGNTDDLVNMGASILTLLIFSIFTKKPPAPGPNQPILSQ